MSPGFSIFDMRDGGFRNLKVLGDIPTKLSSGESLAYFYYITLCYLVHWILLAAIYLLRMLGKPSFLGNRYFVTVEYCWTNVYTKPIRMGYILRACNPLQIIGSIIGLITILVINLTFWRSRTVKSRADQMMDSRMENTIPVREPKDHISIVTLSLDDRSNDGSLSRWADPANKTRIGYFVEMFISWYRNRQPLFFHGGMLSQEIV